MVPKNNISLIPARESPLEVEPWLGSEGEITGDIG